MFAYRLAAQLGHANVDQMLAGMTGRQVADWQQYYQLEPFGQERGDLRAAIIACTLANCFSKRRFRLDDFMLKFGPPRRQSVEEMSASFERFAKAHNASLKRRG